MMNGEEIELMEIFNVLWRRKLLIILGVLICTITTWVVSFLLKPVYEISAVVQTAKIFVQDQSGRYEEISIENPKQIASRITEKSYDTVVANELKISLEEFPEIEAEEIRDTFLVRISTRDHEIERGKKIISSIIKYLKKDIDEKVDAELKAIDTQIDTNKSKIKSLNLSIQDKKNEIKDIELIIQSKEIQKGTLYKDIEATKNKIKISEERTKTLLDEMKVVKEKMDKLEEESRKALKEGGDEKNAIPMLLYSNEIQNNLRYYNSLEERLSQEKINFENLNVHLSVKEHDLKQLNIDISQLKNKIDIVKNEIEKIKTEIEEHKNTIDSLKQKKRLIDKTSVVKPPTPSLYPVFPKKRLNVAITFILSSIFFSLLAFFIEYIEKHGEKAP
ncbi:MAG: Wzz/FepE/Etk N-terminal domain-containing protein [Candidatus Aminicenantia bacterium]